MGSPAPEGKAKARDRMKMIGMKIKTSLLAVFLLFVASTSFAAIQNTKHDLSFFTTAWPGSPSYQTDETHVCIFCHTPHGGSLSGPLWNRSNPAAGAFTMYNSAYAWKTELNSVATVNDESLLCLSCHDGSIAVNSLLNTGNILGGQPNVLENYGSPTYIAGTTGSSKRTGGTQDLPNSTGHLEDDHPISLNYVNAVSDQTVNGTNALQTLAYAKGQGIEFFGNNQEFLECSSCHDVHDNSFPPFLIMSNSGSGMCLSCHIK